MSIHRVITKSKQTRQNEAGDFLFTREMIPALSADWTGPAFIRDYRERAWESYITLPMPTMKDDAWRRTDIHGFDAESFNLPEGSSNVTLSSIPGWLLKPLVKKIHGGQIIIQPEQSIVKLNEKLTQQGVIFTDLRTAERDYAEKLAAILGQIVKPSEGKFAALTAAFEKYGIFIYHLRLFNFLLCSNSPP